jgi:DNA polymerase-3 subunit epsilon
MSLITAVYVRELRASALVLDTETTGRSYDDEIIEIAIVKAIDGSVVYDRRFKPSKPVGASRYVHGISDGELRKEDPFNGFAYAELERIMEGSIIVAYNAEFDRRLFAQTLKKYDFREIACEWKCAMKLYSEFRDTNKNVSLKDACAAFNVKPGAHRALSDALACARVLYKIAEAAPKLAPELIDLPATSEPADDDDDEIMMTAADFLIQFGWREKSAGEWKDAETGRLFPFLVAMERQRERMK